MEKQNKNIKPGDIVLIEGIIFPNNRPDPHKNGRPCIVLYPEEREGQTFVHYLICTTQKENLFLHNDQKCYDIVNISQDKKGISLVDLSHVYTTTAESVIKPVGNIKKDYFRIIEHVLYFHQNDQDEKMQRHLQILEAASSEKVIEITDKKTITFRHLVLDILNFRYKEINEKARQIRKENRESRQLTKPDHIDQKLERRKRVLIKKRKELKPVAIF